MKDMQKQVSRALFFLLLGTVCALLCFAVTVGVLIFTEQPPVLPALIGGLLLCGSEIAVAFLYKRGARPEEKPIDASVQKMTTDVLKKLSFPVVIVLADGKISWPNSVMEGLLNSHDYHGNGIGDILDVPLETITGADTFNGCDVRMFGEPYRVRSYLMSAPNMDFWMLFFEDRGEYLALEDRRATESPVIVYAVLDNIDRINQFVRTSSRDVSNRIEKVLTDWAESLNGFIREYDRDKYMIQFPQKQLAACVENGFTVLNEIRAASDSAAAAPVTVSMGISECGLSVREREADAVAALETALQRGGDQVVLRDRNGRSSYFGGKTKTDISNTRLGTRTWSGKIIQMISEAGNVLIMGHSSPDFDSIGACVGLCRLAQSFNENVRIVVNRAHPNFRVCTETLLRKQPEYERLFISGEEGLELIASDTLLIVTDVNNLKIVECPEIAANLAPQIIIDHHRKVTDFAVAPAVALIEPGTSSACELVAELLEFAAAANPERLRLPVPTAAEADVMLSGIVLDTKNFTRSTGSETFAAAMFLQTNGADTERVRAFFRSEEADFISEARLNSNVRRFRDRIVITAEKVQSTDGKISAEDRIIASRVAESLLSLRDVDASFSMVYSDSEVLISGRSNGKVNVQLILETFGGGGRYDAAGAQLTGKSFQVVSEELKAAIEAFLDADKETAKGDA